MRQLLRKALGSLVVLTVPVVMVGALLTPHESHHHHDSDATAVTAPVDDARGEPNDVRDELEDGTASGHAGTPAAVDLLGNEVSDAVAQYKLDAAGSLYEVHSPQTELPRLGSPKS